MTDRIRALMILIVLAAPSARAQDAADFPEPYNSEDEPGEPMSPAEAAAALALPGEGFRVDLFAAEPEVRNPIGLAWDPKGRLWVAECYTYAEYEKKFDLGLRDRVLILTDRDGDGRMDERKVFTDQVQRLTSVEVGRGGAWLMCPPQVLFIPDRDGDDRPDGPAEVVLDGFDLPPENYHNCASGLKFGPDGWLYGRCGASAPGSIGRPGTPDDQRIPLAGGMWRYHPDRKTVEVLNAGTTNPWGHDWNEYGEAFFINTVCGHLWHSIPGAHFVRSHTIDPNPLVYEPIDHHADHWHWDHSKDWTDSRNVTPEHDRAGGGHAHVGMLIYGADQWPEAYRGRLMTWNMHGRRVNVERLERDGTGYAGRHEPDILRSGDPWCRITDLTYGPDGSVYLLDWSDTGECHENTGVHRSSGRIFKVSHGDPKPIGELDLSKYRSRELVALHASPNEWHVRQARVILAERASRGHGLDGAAGELRRLFDEGADPVVKLRAMWTLFAIGKADSEFLTAQLGHPHESVRAWAIRFLTDGRPIDTVTSRRPGPSADAPMPAELLDRLEQMANEDPSGLVRLTLASTLQRLPVGERAVLALNLASREEDAADHNQPAMIWYGLIPTWEAGEEQAASIAPLAAMPALRRWSARYCAEVVGERPEALATTLSLVEDQPDEVVGDVLEGLAEGLRGTRKAPKPEGWDALSARLADSEDSALRDRARELSVVFGDGRALDEVRAVALDDTAELEARRAALRTLIEARPDDLREICEELLEVRFLNTTAVRGLAAFDDPEIGRRLVERYRTFHPSERPSLIDTLVSRPSFARALLDAIADGKVERGDVSAFHARQVASFGDSELSARLAEVWGEVREGRADRKPVMAAWKPKLGADALAGADLSNGRAVFKQTCASCHRLYGDGGQIGPDLTGAGRDNLDYLLENVFDPAAVVTADFRMSVVALADGRVLNGIVLRRDDRAITLQTQDEKLVIPADEVEQIEVSDQSLMPEGQMENLTEEQVRDLFAYLMSRSQVALPGE